MDNDAMRLLWVISIVLCIVAAVGLYLTHRSGMPNVTNNTIEKVGVYAIENFSYSGHQYIKFTNNGGYNSVNIIHNPDCPCLKLTVKE